MEKGMMIRRRRSSTSSESDASDDVIKFLCSYGGRILPRLTDGMLRYVGGHTRVLSVDRHISYTELMVKLGEFCGSSVKMRCQLPDGDLETLISITCDQDLRHVMAEYGKANPSNSDSSQRLKIRAILSPPKSLKSISPPVSPSTPTQFNSPTSICPPPAMKEARCVFGRPFLTGAGNNHHHHYYLVRQPRSYSCIN